MRPVKPILIVLVLYKMSFDESSSYRSLASALAAQPSLDALFDLLVVDNSPAPHATPPGFHGSYLHDGTNPGLAKRYNFGLQAARAAGNTWLMLLDQDTTPTLAYLNEVAATTSALSTQPEAVAIIPKLIEDGQMQSPHPPLFRDGTQPIARASHGIQHQLLRAYNSGAVLRVRALEAAGGFPEEYWLDYLDHAVFHRLQAAGGTVFLLNAELGHEMSIHQPNRAANPAHAARHANQLAAERLFYRQHGSPAERRRHRKSLLREALRSIARGSLAESARFLRAAL